MISLTVFLFLFSHSFEIPTVSNNVNVLLITVDDLRADHLGCYGSSIARARHIDQIAKEGTIVESLFYRTKDFPVPRNRDWENVEHILAGRHYSTLIFDAHFQQKRMTLNPVLSWLERNRERRFFCWVRFSASKPYEVPAVFAKDFSLLPDKRYESQIAFIDYQIGRIRDCLARFDLLPKTATILTTSLLRDWKRSNTLLPLLYVIPGDAKAFAKREPKQIDRSLLEWLQLKNDK